MLLMKLYDTLKKGADQISGRTAIRFIPEEQRVLDVEPEKAPLCVDVGHKEDEMGDGAVGQHQQLPVDVVGPAAASTPAIIGHSGRISAAAGESAPAHSVVG